MAILDWLKEVPLSAVYKELLIDSENKIRALEQENIALKAEIVILKEQVEQQRATQNAINQGFGEDKHNNSFRFDENTGTWINAVDGLRYCPKCKAQNIPSPLANESHGWSCPVCASGFYDPARPHNRVNP